jgi:D-alanyl-D-alanine carboxypeptidase/D-alanyl-D-alanine-endopeptidase (penicillin-binding protein 4)
VDYAPSRSRIDVGYTVCEFDPLWGGQQEGCVPDKDQPMWPSSDEDSTAGTPPEQGGDGGATAQLPVPQAPRPVNGESATQYLAVPKITRPEPEPEQKTSWFQPAEPKTPPPRQPPQQRSPQQQQQQRPEPQRPDPARQEQARQEQARQEQARQEQARQEQRRQEQQRQDQYQERQDQPFDPYQDQHEQQPPSRRQPLRRLPQVPVAPHAVPMRIEPSGEQHPAEATTGIERPQQPLRPFEDARLPDPEPADTAEPPEPPKAAAPPPPGKPKRKKRGILIGAFAVLLVAALGVAAALPQVSNRLELPWAPNKPKGDAPQPVAVSLAMHAPEATAPVPTAGEVAKVLTGPAANSAFTKLTGSVIDAETGTVLWDRNSGQVMTPASNTKLLTVAAALLTIDDGYQLSTRVVQGAQPGTVILVGGGDPTLNSLPAGKESVYSGSARLDDLVAQVKKAGGGAVTKVQLDVNGYAGPPTAQGWDASDAPSTYAATMVPVMLDGGRSNPADDHAQRVANPATAAAQQLAARLGGGAAYAGLATAPKEAKVLGEVKSAPLTELVNNLLQISDNALADAVARQTAISTGAEPSFAGAAQATKDVLAKNGFDLTGVQLNDGSGLSGLNKIPAKLLSQILAVAAGPDGKDPRTAKLRPLLGGLPVAGGSGTLADRYRNGASAGGKGWVRAKTGSLTATDTLAGVVMDTDGRVLVFALMSTGPNVDASRAGLDAVAAALRGCGCR